MTAAVLQLAGELAEHLRGPADVLGVSEWLARHAAAAPAGRDGASAAGRKILACQRTREQLLPMIERYAEAKRFREVLDFGDQVTLAARIAQRHPEVGAGERGRYQAVLLDEYQDTSEAQLVLLRTLFGGGHPVTAVGDPCQSIYGWRGASAGNLRRFATDFRRRPVRGRCPPASATPGGILDAAAVIQSSLRAEAPQVPRLVAAPDRARRGRVTCALLRDRRRRGRVGRPARWTACCGCRRASRRTGKRWPDGRKDAVRPSDIAVLCRKRVQFDLLRKALEARGIPVEVVGLGGLLTVPEVQDVVATLRVLHDPTASDALARLLTGPRWRIGPTDLIALGRRARKLAATGRDPAGPADEQAEGDALTQAVADLTADAGSLIEALDDLGDPAAYSPAGHARLSALAAELRTLRAHAARPLADLVGEVERTLSLDIEVAARPGADPAAARADLDAFAGTAAAFGADQEEATLGAFLAYLAAAQEEEFGLEAGRVGETDTVKLVTVHAAKGLQWARGRRARPVGRGPQPGLPGPAAADDALDGQPAAAPVRPARRRGRPARAGRPGPGVGAVVRPGLRGPGAGRGTPADVRGGHPGRVLARLLGLLVGGRRAAARAVGVPGGDRGRVPGRRRDGGALGAAAGARRREPRAGRARLGHLARAAVRGPLPGGARGRSPGAGGHGGAIRSGVGAGPPLRKPSRLAQPGPSGPDAVSPASAGPHDAGPDPAGPPDGGCLTRPGRRATTRWMSTIRSLVAAWQRDTTLLLAERERRRGDGAQPVELPEQLSVSALVTLARDPAELASQNPAPDAAAARAAGQAGHGLPPLAGAALRRAAADRPGRPARPARRRGGGRGGSGLPARAVRVRAPGRGRWPQEVEVPFETRIGDRLVRGRIDAVFADSPDGGYDVVDWKTGRPPGSAAERHAVAVQLAAYRLAWAALAGVPLDQVRAAFYYVRHDLTISPADLLDAAGLAALIESVPSARSSG